MFLWEYFGSQTLSKETREGLPYAMQRKYSTIVKKVFTCKLEWRVAIQRTINKETWDTISYKAYKENEEVGIKMHVENFTNLHLAFISTRYRHCPILWYIDVRKINKITAQNI